MRVRAWPGDANFVRAGGLDANLVRFPANSLGKGVRGRTFLQKGFPRRQASGNSGAQPCIMQGQRITHPNMRVHTATLITLARTAWIGRIGCPDLWRNELRKTKYCAAATPTEADTKSVFENGTAKRALASQKASS